MSPVVTVIVAGWNVARYAEEALTSLHAQTREDWRAILVDDGSDDGTGTVFDRFAAWDTRFTAVHHTSRRGLGAARNSGLELVDTPYVGFLDADDVMEPRALALLVGSLENSGSDLAVGAYRRLRPGTEGYLLGDVQPWVAASTAPSRRRVTLEQHPEVVNNIVAWSKVSRSQMWGDVRFPAGLYEDQLIAQELYTSARWIDTVADPVVQWRVRADGSSITQGEARIDVLRAVLAAMRTGLEVLRRRGPQAAVLARARTILTMDVPRLGGHALDHPDPAYAAELEDFRREVALLLP
ncbi:glycosyltransferase family 2 protein [Microbacterium sp. Marseille-Q6965]|uniref:glycosyltransferase family 2 protein n=1 Tax=Microbacterium sp. Marseille-Q6965 TaxID=2965072 RepID=UPI0021B71B07|nr:glycosyltransferase family 2 protein [Microbacterium sp. Marseille-Q6965]